MNVTATSSDTGRAAPKPGTVRLVVNFVAFQLGWFACIWGAANDMPAAGTTIAALVVGVHLFCAVRPLEELKLIIVAVVAGAVFDSLLLATGFVQFHSVTFISGLAPYWILALWALFATTLNVSLSWLRGRWLLAAVLGAIAGPLSYWAGARLGAAMLVQPMPAIAAMAAEWAIAMPLLMFFAQRFDGVQQPAAIAEVIHV